MSNLLDECTLSLLETAPQIIRAIRREMRNRRSADLSVPQFRALAFIHNNKDASLSDLADHLGLTLASTSKLADGLVRKNLITRAQSTVDRRRLILCLTKSGESIYDLASAGTRSHLANLMGRLSQDELRTVNQAFQLLQPIFSTDTIS
jgi:DNA-binding MarR family transcriptional regulator